MTPEVILRELGQIAIGDIELETTDGRKLVLRRVARPMGGAETDLDGPATGDPRTLESRPDFVVKTRTPGVGFFRGNPSFAAVNFAS